MKPNNSVSIILSAYNEENNIEPAVESVLKAVKNQVPDFEIIIVNDGSTDKTGEIIQKLARRNRKIKVINYSANLGLGYAIKDAIKLAKKTYITSFSGDNDMSWKSLRDILLKRGKADIVSAYMANPQKRSIFRRILSRSYVVLMNFLFRLNLKYYNGYFICKRKLLNNLPIKSEGFTIFAEIKTRLLRRGVTLLEIPFEHTGRKSGKSKATSIKSLIQTAKNVITLFGEFYLKS